MYGCFDLLTDKNDLDSVSICFFIMMITSHEASTICCVLFHWLPFKIKGMSGYSELH